MNEILRKRLVRESISLLVAIAVGFIFAYFFPAILFNYIVTVLTIVLWLLVDEFYRYQWPHFPKLIDFIISLAIAGCFIGIMYLILFYFYPERSWRFLNIIPIALGIVIGRVFIGKIKIHW